MSDLTVESGGVSEDLPIGGAAVALGTLLGDPERRVREAAARALAALAPLGEQLLTAALASPQVATRAAAVAGLAGLPEASDAVTGALSDEAPEVRCAAVDAMVRLALPTEPLVEALRLDAAAAVRRAAARGITARMGQGAVEALVEALGDDPVRETALLCLDELGWAPDSDTGAAILALAQRDWAALAGLGEAAVPLLRRAVSDAKPDKESVAMRARAVETLGAIGSESAAAAAMVALGDVGLAARAQATRTLGRLAAKAPAEAGRVLHRLLLSDPHAKVRVGAATALGLMGFGDAKADLRARAEGDPDETVRYAASEALAALGDTGLLVDQLDCSDPRVRLAAVERLGELGATETVDALIGMLGDPLATVRAASMAALEALGWTPVGVKRAHDDVRYSRWMTRAEQVARTGLETADQRALLAADLRAADPLVRQAALEALAMRRDGELAALAMPLLDDGSRAVRETAAETLRALDAAPSEGADGALYCVASGDLKAAAALGEVALPALLRALRHHGANDRAEAARLLGPLGGQEAVEALEAALSDPVAYVQVNAIVSLGAAAGEAGIDGLSGLLAAEHSTVRTAAARTLAGLAATEALLAGLTHGESVAREAAALALGRILEAPEAVIAALLERLADDSSAAVRSAAARALGRLKAGAASGALREAATDDPSWRVRREAALAVGAVGDKAQAEGLLRTLGDSYEAVREAGLKALERLDWTPDGDVATAMLRLAQEDWRGLVSLGEPAVDLLTQTVGEAGNDKIAVARRCRAVETLEAIGLETAEAAEAVIGAMREALEDVAAPVRALAARACGRLEATAAGPRLLEMATKDADEHTQVAAATALGRAGTVEMAAALTRLAESAESANVRLAASRALAGPAIGDIAQLVMALTAPDEGVRLEAAKALGATGEAAAIEPLIEALGDAVAGVRVAARGALEQLGWMPVGVKADAGAAGYRRWLTVSDVGGAPEDGAVDQAGLLVEALKSPAAEVRLGALEALEDRREAGAAAAVRPLLEDDEEAVRRQAAVTLVRLEAVPTEGAAAAAARVALGEMAEAAALGEVAVPALLRALREHGPVDRAAVVRVLPAVGEAATCVAAAQDEDARVRVAAVAAMPAEAAVLRGLCGDPVATVRWAAARRLAAVSEAALAAAAESDEVAVRQAVVRAIAELEAPSERLMSVLTARAAGDDDAAVRTAALTAVAAARGLEATALLAERLEADPAFRVREAAAKALGRLPLEDAAAVLVPALGDGYSEVREAALAALASSGWEPDDGVTRAILALAGEDWRALEAVGEAAVPLMAQALAEREADPASQLKRVEVVNTLARIGGEAASEAAREALADPSGRVRAAAAAAVGRMGLRAAGPDLLAAMESDRDSRVRSRAAAAIGALGLAEFAPQLAMAASQDDDSMVRTQAAIALAGPGIGNVERLIGQLGDEAPEVRRTAASELGRLGAKKGIDPLIATLADAYATVRVAAREALLAIGWVPFGVRRNGAAAGYDRWVLRQELGPKSLEQPQLAVLAGAVGHPEPMMRLAVAEALGLLDDPGARGLLEQLSRDTHPEVAARAKAELAD